MKNIDLELIEKLAENMNEHSLTEISLETGDQKLVLKKEKKTAEIVTAAAPQKVARPVEKVEKKEKQSAEGLSGNIITSPMVGTFYRSPAPGAEVFVQEGQNIKAGDPVCIIEAMKMMNEVNSQFSGKVVRILVEDGVVVQKGDKLFIIE
ncbi:acetyl-CoA carboxylase biotin carboxyl carrier protein [Fusobacterium perfoetens]|uniref:acetyl-CoA carboxylase biotin carboxyl carrier protein n=1 Tax=Fusobacterium perfoetens TaxID=852 RepID=UPI001F2272C2|nr:acetyl-CoA carboxylase biotin carboxyl carrier protein [Fusobacterium perfoetens]MCF2624725.1 acetyl-CoA carboxylase biotin carboxyl carrier protein [Fusobacterium perfoetens]